MGVNIYDAFALGFGFDFSVLCDRGDFLVHASVAQFLHVAGGHEFLVFILLRHCGFDLVCLAFLQCDVGLIHFHALGVGEVLRAIA